MKEFDQIISRKELNTRFAVGDLFSFEKIQSHFGDPQKSKIAFLTDTLLASTLAPPMVALLEGLGYKVTLFCAPPGEMGKRLEVAATLYEELLEKEFHPTDLLVGFGGGSICDLSGFIASTFMRGMALILIPTTLLSMVDASIGGKNAINIGSHKNVVGSFYPPKSVLIDTSFLSTLSPRAIRSGLAEMIKHALLQGDHSLELFFGNAFEDRTLFEELILKNLKFKIEITSHDPLSLGLRNILNFGHTFGHALELLSAGELSHGEAVGIGMAIESHLSAKVCKLPESDLQTILRLLALQGYRVGSLSELPIERLLCHLTSDKKGSLAGPSCVFLQKIGQVACFDGEFKAPLSMEMIEEGYRFLGELDAHLSSYKN